MKNSITTTAALELTKEELLLLRRAILALEAEAESKNKQILQRRTDIMWHKLNDKIDELKHIPAGI